jgi:tetratricopeptide (TPR) repeat protein
MTRACLLAITLLSTTQAYADKKKEAKAHVAAGTKLYNVQQYAQAADEYQAAYLLDPKPEYLYAIAQAQRLGGDCDKAVKSYEAYIRAKPPAGQLEKAQKNIDRCHEDIQSRASMNDLPPPEEVPPLPPAPPEPVEEAPKPPVILVAPPPPPPPGKSYLIGHVLVGGGVAIGAASTFLFLHGKSAIEDINAASTYDTFAMKKPGFDTAKTQQTLGVVGMAAGGALVIGGIVYYVMHSQAPDDEAPVVAPAPAPGGATVTVSGRF